MKVKITYEYDKKHPPHFFARASVNGEELLAAGDTWERAKLRLTTQINLALQAHNVPKPEEIEVEI